VARNGIRVRVPGGSRAAGDPSDPLSDLLRIIEGLPPGPLYAAITVLAAVENFFPPVPADTAVALGAFLAGRGVMHAGLVFGLTWGANVLSAAGVYFLARRYGRAVFTGRMGARLLSAAMLERIATQYHRHGTWGIFVSRLLPVWRAVVCPFAGIAGLSAPRVLIPIALASAAYYGLLVWFVARLGGNFEQVVTFVRHLNVTLGVLAGIAALVVGWLVWRRRRTP
jgi:membrane protein DedA with SNARE-associated domain